MRALAGLFLLAAACVPHVSTGCDLETPYSIAVQRWTAHADLYDPLIERASFTATIESRIFREQRVRVWAKDVGLSPEVQAARLASEMQASEAETAFLVGGYTDRPRDNNLGDVQSIWRVALETPGGELAPTRIEQLGRPDDNLRKLYPYLDLFSRAYRVHFARVPEGPVTLRIASGIGIADLTFERL